MWPHGSMFQRTYSQNIVIRSLFGVNMIVSLGKKMHQPKDDYKLYFEMNHLLIKTTSVTICLALDWLWWSMKLSPLELTTQYVYKCPIVYSHQWSTVECITHSTDAIHQKYSKMMLQKYSLVPIHLTRTYSNGDWKNPP